MIDSAVVVDAAVLAGVDRVLAGADAVARRGRVVDALGGGVLVREPFDLGSGAGALAFAAGTPVLGVGVGDADPLALAAEAPRPALRPPAPAPIALAAEAPLLAEPLAVTDAPALALLADAPAVATAIPDAPVLAATATLPSVMIPSNGPDAVVAWASYGPDPVIAAVVKRTDGSVVPNGRTIQELQPFGAYVYLGYGDWSNNTGPVDLRRLDLAAERYETRYAAMQTESVLRLRVIDGVLYAVGQDPIQGTQPDYVRDDGAAATLVSNATVDGAHLFDVLKFSVDGKLYLTGQSHGAGSQSPGAVAGHDAAVWYSSDDGATWTTKVVDITYGRIVGMPDVGGYLWAQPVSWSTGSIRPTAYRSANGATWTSTSADLIPQSNGNVWKPYTLAGRSVYLTHWSFASPLDAIPNYVTTFDGTTVTEITGIGQAIDLHYDGQWLWVLTEAGTIVATFDFSEWFAVADAVPAGAKSVCAVDGRLYVGTAGSEVYRAWRGPGEAMPTPPAPALALATDVPLVGNVPAVQPVAYTAKSQTGASVTFNVPTGTANGDVMVHVCRENDAAKTKTPPAGWTQAYTSGESAGHRLRVYTRVASSEPATYAWASSPSDGLDLWVGTYRGVDAVAPIDDQDAATGTDATPNVPSLDASDIGGYLIYVAKWSGTRTPTAPAGFAARLSTSNVHVADRAFDGPAATGGVTCTLNSAATHAATMLALKPA
jgi:hypothetical protein